MKNADRTAMPNRSQSPDNVFGGLTKREMIAMNLMSGILSNQDFSYDGFSGAALMAIEATDALLEELEK